MKVLSRSQIANAHDVRFEYVSTPEWAPFEVTDEGSNTPRPLTEAERAEYGVRIRSLSGAGRAIFIKDSIAQRKAEETQQEYDVKVEMLLCMATICDENGKLLFQNNREDFAILAERNSEALARVAEAASKLSGLDKAAQAAAKKP